MDRPAASKFLSSVSVYNNTFCVVFCVCKHVRIFGKSKYLTAKLN